MGKSFEIRPTGIANVLLKLPRDSLPAGLEYPKSDSPEITEDLWLEHYTWKKVTTNVSGFIVGSPSIDHYGDMIVSISIYLLLSLSLTASPIDYQPSDWGSSASDLQTSWLERQRCL